MRGNNPIRKPVMDDGQELAVQEVFYTIQGEGPYAGWPAVFVRLGGCNLACDFCDTEFESFATMKLEMLLERVQALRPGGLVVITGGEPLRQNIAPLCTALLDAGYMVQIETNGTLFRELPKAVSVVCSPKNTSGTYVPVRGDLLAQVTAFKFLVSATKSGYQQVPEIGQGSAPVYVQPMDEYDAKKNADNLALATRLALQYGHRLSLQLHKIAGIP